MALRQFVACLLRFDLAAVSSVRRCFLFCRTQAVQLDFSLRSYSMTMAVAAAVTTLVLACGGATAQPFLPGDSHQSRTVPQHLYVLLAESCGKLGRCWLACQMVDSALPLFCEQTDWSPHRHGQQIHAAGRPETASRNASRRNSSGDARKGVHEKVPLSAADL